MLFICIDRGMKENLVFSMKDALEYERSQQNVARGKDISCLEGNANG